MSETNVQPGLLARVGIAFAAFFRALWDAAFAGSVQGLREGKRLALPERTESAPKKTEAAPKKEAPLPVLREAGPDAALQLLSLLQREGRFIDFLEEDVSAFSDAQIGAAARVVHTQCRAALREHIPLEPIRSEEEGEKITLQRGFDAQTIRLGGNVSGEPPYTGSLSHRGWRAREVKLPKMAEGHDASIVAPAEIEL